MYSRVLCPNHDDDDHDEGLSVGARGDAAPVLNDTSGQTTVPHHRHAVSPQADPDDVFGLFSNDPTKQSPPSHQQQQQQQQGPDSGTTAAADTSPEGPPTPPALDFPGVVDYEERDGATGDKRELLLIAIPLHQDPTDPINGLVFLPVANFQDEKDYSGVTGGMRRRLDALHDKMGTKWDEMKAAEPGTFNSKVYKVGHSVANDLSPEERLTRNIPENVSKVIIYHPGQVCPSSIMERLHSMTATQSNWTTAKAAVAAVCMPIAFGIDILIIPGPSVLTWYTGLKLYQNASSAVGSQRLTRYLRHEGNRDVRVNYAVDERLDAYWDLVCHAHDGALDEEDCEQLVQDINQQELLEPLLELRKRWLAANLPATRSVDGQAEYTTLRTSDTVA